MKKPFESMYKKANSLEYRLQKSKRLREKFVDHVPVVCEKADDSDIGDLDKSKFLVPSDLTIGRFMMLLRKRVQLEPEDAIFVFVNGSVPPTTAEMSDLYSRFKDEDGFLYIKYSKEATMG